MGDAAASPGGPLCPVPSPARPAVVAAPRSPRCSSLTALRRRSSDAGATPTPASSGRTAAQLPGHRHRRRRRAHPRRAARDHRLDVGDGHRDALRHRRRRPGRGRRRHLELPRGRADHRPVGLHPERRGDRRLRARPRGPQRRPERHRRRPRRPRGARRCCSPAAETLDDSYAQLEALGDATGHAEEADEVVADMQDRIDAAVASVPDDVEGMRVYHELDPSFFSAGSSTFIGGIYALFGLENIADGAADAAGGYPQLSAEYVVGQAPGPDRAGRHQVLRPDRRDRRPAAGLRHACPPSRRGGSSEADDDIASRWGPAGRRLRRVRRRDAAGLRTADAMTTTARGTRAGTTGGAAPAPPPAGAWCWPGRVCALVAALLAGVWVGALPLPPGAVVVTLLDRVLGPLGHQRPRRAQRHRGGGAAAAAAAPRPARRAGRAPGWPSPAPPTRASSATRWPTPTCSAPPPGAGLGATLVIAYSPVQSLGPFGDRARWPRSSARWSASAAPSPSARSAGGSHSPTLLLAGVAVAAVPGRRPDPRAAAEHRRPARDLRLAARPARQRPVVRRRRSCCPTSARPASSCCSAAARWTCSPWATTRPARWASHPGRLRLLVILAASLATAAAVAVSGLIGFVGLVVPHIARRLVGGSHARVLPVSLLIGGGFLVLADLIARVVLAPAELPIGVVTAFIGAPFFAGPALGRGAATMTGGPRRRPRDGRRPGRGRRPDRGVRPHPRAGLGPADRRAGRLAGDHRPQRLGQVDAAALGPGLPPAPGPGPDRRRPDHRHAAPRPRPVLAYAPQTPVLPEGRHAPATTSPSAARRTVRCSPRPARVDRQVVADVMDRLGLDAAGRAAADHPVRRRAAARRPGPGARPAAAGAAARRADRGAGPRARPAGARPRRPAPPAGRAHRAQHAARPDAGRPVRRPAGAAVRGPRRRRGLPRARC